MLPDTHPATLPAEQSPAQRPESLTAQRPHCETCQGACIVAKRGICRDCGGSGFAPSTPVKAAA